MIKEETITAEKEVIGRTSLYRDAWRRLRRNKLAMLGGIIILAFILCAISAPLLAPYDPYEQDLYKRLKPPGSENLLGTDDFGRDLLSRIIYGSRLSLMIGVISVSIALTVGVTLGLISGYYGGAIDSLIMRIMDIMLAFPAILLAIAIVATWGRPGLAKAMVAVGIVAIPPYARLVRSSVLSVKEKEYIEAVRSLGAKDLRIILLSVLPNCFAPIIVQATLGIASAILDAAGLSFLGLGAQPPIPEWGAMLNGGRTLIIKAGWVVTYPGIAIVLAVLGFNLFGDGLRDALDPRLKY